MPKKGYKQTEEHKIKISEYVKKNSKRYWLGKKREDISKKMKGRIMSPETRLKMSDY